MIGLILELFAMVSFLSAMAVWGAVLCRVI
jgi:hypothetical protein